MSRVLAPHKEQDRYAYIRVMRYGHDEHGRQMFVWECEPYRDGGSYITGCRADTYHDGATDARTISSRRVEEAVEEADYRRKCAEEGLSVWCPFTNGRSFWMVYDGRYNTPAGTYHPHAPVWGEYLPVRFAKTLRAAYHRYRAATDKAATR